MLGTVWYAAGFALNSGPAAHAAQTSHLQDGADALAASMNLDAQGHASAFARCARLRRDDPHDRVEIDRELSFQMTQVGKTW